MEVILTQDIRNLGYKNDIVKVKNGYGRNYLIPRGFATMVNDASRKVHAETMKQKAFKEEKIKKEAEKLLENLKNITVKIGAKAGTTGKIYGSVNAMQIADAIKEQFNFEVDKRKIQIEGESIKETGTYTAKVQLHKEISVDVTFEVIAE